ncbi:hypothetical protein ACF0H5_003875 [Mactra antiquata]
MMMREAFFVNILILFQIIHVSVPHCNEHKDCKTCTRHKTWNQEPCRWCPLDQECHAKWSLRNHCKWNQNILSERKCYKNNGGKMGYNSTEAYKLALFSAIAYSDEPDKCLQALFPKNDYYVVNTIRRNCGDYFFNYDKHCLVFLVYSHKNREVIVAFRGTRGIKQIIDQVLTHVTLPVVSSAIGGKVQHYFNNVHEEFYHQLKNLINDLKNWFPKYRIKLTGHSLGGAAASITSAMLVKHNILKPEDISLYTYGMPRVGNKRYALEHDRLVPDSWRVVRDDDVVAKLPTCKLFKCSFFNGPYHHGNKIIYPGHTMTQHSRFYLCKGNEDTKSECKKFTRGKLMLSVHFNRLKRGTFKYSLDKHKNYFGIPIGTFCRDHILKQD